MIPSTLSSTVLFCKKWMIEYLKSENDLKLEYNNKFQQLYENTKRYEFTDAQFKKYNASRTIIQDYYNKIHKK